MAKYATFNINKVLKVKHCCKEDKTCHSSFHDVRLIETYHRMNKEHI